MTTILCVEDQPEIRNDIVGELSQAGYEVIDAADGEAGLNAILKQMPDLVLCDISMPGMGGLDLLHQVRNHHPECGAMPFVFLTAMTDRDYIIKGRMAGCDDYLTKPVDFDILLATVHSRLAEVTRITDQKKEENRSLYEVIDRLQWHDALTGLPNRASFLRMLESKNEGASDDGMQEGHILLIDVDGLKEINEIYGHQAGNFVLSETALRLQSVGCLPGEMARCGDDEFALLPHPPLTLEDTISLGKQLLGILSLPFHFSGMEIFVSFSAGVVPCANNLDDPPHVLSKAGIALDMAKQDGGNTLRVFDMEAGSQRKIIHELRGRLLDGLQNEQFELYYQPLISADSKAIMGAEALIRWNHPEHGLVSPAQFIPIAEEMGLIRPLGEWVLKTAARQAKRWRSSVTHPFRISVNLSAEQARDPNLANRVLEILSQEGVRPEWMELELTESTIATNRDVVVNNLKTLREAGITIAIDDFGTGYSSLAYLKDFYIDVLKIDRSFVRNLPADEEQATITQAIISLGHSLGMSITAEGVETNAQASFLTENGCNHLQGYFYGKPMSAIDFESKGLLP